MENPGMLIKDSAPRTLKAGKKPSERSIDELLASGVIALDKVQGPTSHQVTAWVRDILGIKRIGHGGTLDPHVSGVLPIATGKATRATDLVLRSDKEYVCHMKLHKDVPKDKVRAVIATFVGNIYQTPPVRAAVKRQLRIRRVHFINVLEIDGRNVLFRVGCDAGTYIRTLAVDIGEALGVGANMEALRRTRSGQLVEHDSYTLQEMKDAVVAWKEDRDETQLRAMVMPFELLLDPLPKIIIKDSAVDAICHGADLAAAGVIRLDPGVNKGATIALFTQKGEGVALGITLMDSESIFKAVEGNVVRSDRVFMPAGTYPKMWVKQQC